MTESPLLEVRNLRRSFGALMAVDDVSFTLDRGRIYGFIGPNGAGKTTTMRILATLDVPDSGDAVLEGLSVLVEPRRVRDRVGFMSDQFEPYANLDVLQYLDFFARAYGLRGRARIDAVRSVASFCGLDSFASRPATGLSKGMGQRLHLAKTLLHDPSLLILDEPASGLDPRARIEFRALLRELSATGKTILISSHILAELSETCDGVLVIEQGRLMASGKIGDIARSVRDRHRMRLRVLGDQDLAERFLVVQPQVHDVRVVEGRVEFEFAGDEDAAAELLRRAVDGGLRVVEFVAQGANLEEIFMTTTRGRLS
ncbi:MAG: putative transporter ATP-binding protein YbhF [Planctomycetota bacterium]